jgi:hypothetical protein
VERTEQQANRPDRGPMDAGRSGATNGPTGEPTQSTGAGGSMRQPTAEQVREAREKSADFKSSLADKLEVGADQLRSKTRQGAERVAAASADLGAAATQRLGNYSDTVATGMERTAGWLRRRDLGDIGDAIVEQVQEHPVRTLLVTLAIGFFVGRSFSD